MTCTIDRFKSDIQNHRMHVIRDEGVNRHIQFSRPGTRTYYFDLITWPGHLSITGDCGTYVFSRVRDMFTFFNMDQGEEPDFVNPQYWGEKLLAIDRHGGFEQFSATKFKSVIHDWLNEHEFLHQIDADRVQEALELEGWGIDCQSMDDAYRLIREVRADTGYEAFDIEELWDYDLTEYTFRFMWCIRAIRWGVLTYYRGGDRFKRQAQADAFVFRNRSTLDLNA